MSAASRSSFLSGALLLCSGTLLVAASAAPVSAQVPPPAPATGALTPGADPSATSPRADSGRGATLSARYHVRQMENVLERAVQHAADMMRRRLQAVTPDVLALAGTPKAQGFRIDGYGLFFSVEVPRLSESVNWALRVLSQDRDERVLASLQKVYSSEQDPVVRADLERAIRTVQLQLSLTPRAPTAPQRRTALSTTGAVADQVAPPMVAADRSGATASSPAPVAPTPLANTLPATPAAEAPAEAMVDPSAAYEDEVKQALADAMLDYAGSLQLPPAEWVTVAARDAGYMAFPDTVSDMVTVTLSVRVSDLVDFRAQRLTRAQARTRVIVKEF
ncbi:hypothetical protein [Luteitalea pratensis]|nr:hypothetical protein [Luteitalea pratensis]